MLACLTNFIGISRRACDKLDSGPSVSGLYLTDLEGLTMETIDKFVEAEQGTSLELLQTKRLYSAGLVQDDLRKYLMPFYRLNTMADRVQAGEFEHGWHEPVNLERGLYLEKERVDLQRMYINAVEILVEEDYDTEITVREEYFNKVVPVQLKAGRVNRVSIDYEVQGHEAWITMPQEVRVARGSIDAGGFHNSAGCYDCGSGRSMRGSSARAQYVGRRTDIEVRGWSGTGEDSYSYGMRVYVEVRCSYDEFFCQLKEHLKWLLLYRFGIEMLKEWLHSTRINEITVLKADHAGYLLETWEEQYDKKYKDLAQSLRSIVKTLDGKCVTCRGVSYFQSF